jgi:hypothetical protein
LQRLLAHLPHAILDDVLDRGAQLDGIARLQRRQRLFVPVDLVKFLHMARRDPEERAELEPDAFNHRHRDRMRVGGIDRAVKTLIFGDLRLPVLTRDSVIYTGIGLGQTIDHDVGDIGKGTDGRMRFQVDPEQDQLTETLCRHPRHDDTASGQQCQAVFGGKPAQSLPNRRRARVESFGKPSDRHRFSRREPAKHDRFTKLLIDMFLGCHARMTDDIRERL